MTIRILNPLDWSQVKIGDWLKLNGDHERVVKIEVNTDAPTRVDLIHHDANGEERTTFLGVINGIDKIEVVADAEATIGFTGDGEVWFCTNDGVATAVHIPDEASFTKMVGRKTRNEQLEQIIRMQQAGVERLLAQQEAERNARELAEEQLAAALEREAAIPAPAVVPLSVDPQPGPAPSPAAADTGQDASAAPSAATLPA